MKPMFAERSLTRAGPPMASYYLDPYAESYYAPNPLSASQDSLLSNDLFGFASVGMPRTGLRAGSDGVSNTFPIYDADSPFNSPIVPVKSVGMDGRLKTKLMGIGTDGGFLTSPLTLGKSRMVPATGSNLGFDSPVPSLTGSLNGSTSSLSGGANPQDAYRDVGTARAGTPDLGIGMNELRGSMDAGDYAAEGYETSLTASFSKRTRTVSETSVPQYQEFVPTRSAKKHTRDHGAPPIQFVEHRFPTSPPAAARPTPDAPSTARRARKVSEGGTASKTLNKARSCPSLVPGAPSLTDPLTPVSSRVGNFLPGVPYNSPNDEGAAAVAPAVMPFSFADLYNYGLAADSVDDIDPRKSPFAFANELLGAGADTGLARFVDESAQQDFGLVYGHPTPHLAPSGFSSPSTTFNSEPSPPESSHISPGLLVAVMDDGYSLSAPQNPSRQRCLPYNSRPLPPPPVEQASLDPSMFGASAGHRHVSTPTFVPNPTYSYPTNYAPDPGHVHHLGPYAPASWSVNQTQVDDFTGPAETYHSGPTGYAPQHSLPPLPPLPPQHIRQSSLPHLPSHEIDPYVVPHQTSRPFHARSSSFSSSAGLFTAQGGLFEPLPLPASFAEPSNEKYHTFSPNERDDLITTAPSTPHKRGRDLTDDEDYRDDLTDGDGDGDYIPGMGGASPGESGSAKVKRQRVVSAPASVGRRLRPGPRPKSTSRSPQETCQSVFSLSPPPLPYRSVSSPYLSDHSPLLPTEDTGFRPDSAGFRPADDGLGIHNVLAGESALPREVIQSLYNSLPAFVKNGTKVAKRYVCLIEGCDRTFPRKSAIESHIQTHLEDKPFVCPADDWYASFHPRALADVCASDASFVRQHDLRRHERIHSGNKPFPCPWFVGNFLTSALLTRTPAEKDLLAATLSSATVNAGSAAAVSSHVEPRLDPLFGPLPRFVLFGCAITPRKPAVSIRLMSVISNSALSIFAFMFSLCQYHITTHRSCIARECTEQTRPAEQPCASSREEDQRAQWTARSRAASRDPCNRRAGRQSRRGPA